MSWAFAALVLFGFLVGLLFRVTGLVLSSAIVAVVACWMATNFTSGVLSLLMITFSMLFAHQVAYLVAAALVHIQPPEARELKQVPVK